MKTINFCGKATEVYSKALLFIEEYKKVKTKQIINNVKEGDDYYKTEYDYEKAGQELEKSFYRCFNKLMEILNNFKLPIDEYGYEKGEYICQISPDFVEHSFSFCFFYIDEKGEKKKDFNGGIILHGFQETFSVELTSNNEPHWSIHT